MAGKKSSGFTLPLIKETFSSVSNSIELIHLDAD